MDSSESTDCMDPKFGCCFPGRRTEKSRTESVTLSFCCLSPHIILISANFSCRSSLFRSIDACLSTGALDLELALGTNLKKEMNSGDSKGNRNPWEQREHASRAWGILLFGLIGATATTLAIYQLRRTADWFYTELKKAQSSASWRRNATNSSNHGSYRDEAWRRYHQRMREEYEEERERVERIRRMQSVFNRERDKFKRSYENWRYNDPDGYQHIPRDDWYYKADTSYREQKTTYNFSYKHSGNYSMSHHYSVLGLDWSRQESYSDAEIKTAFRTKAMECHPDQNPENKEVAEAKFKEVMTSYEAIKLERKNGRY